MKLPSAIYDVDANQFKEPYRVLFSVDGKTFGTVLYAPSHEAAEQCLEEIKASMQVQGKIVLEDDHASE